MRDATISGIGDAPAAARLPSDAEAGYEGTFTVHDLSAVRRMAAEQGRRARMHGVRLSDFVLAVNEAAPDDADGLRLWVVWQVCTEVSLSYGPGDATVLLSMSTRAACAMTPSHLDKPGCAAQPPGSASPACVVAYPGGVFAPGPG